MHRLWRYVSGDRNHPVATFEHEVHSRGVIATIEPEALATQFAQTSHARKISGRFLDADDVAHLCEARCGLRLHITGCPPRDVIEDLRDRDGLGDELVMQIESLLCGLVVVGRY